MKYLLVATIAIFIAITASSCGLIPTNNDTPPQPVRYLFFKLTEIPETMTDAAVIAQIHDTRNNFLRNAATEVAFPTTDSTRLPPGTFGIRHGLNWIDFPDNGGGRFMGNMARLRGGQDTVIHPIQSGIPYDLYLMALRGDVVGVTTDSGFGSIYFTEGTDTVKVYIQSDTIGNRPHDPEPTFFEFTLDSHNTSTGFATGRFAFIGSADGSVGLPGIPARPRRRFAIFDGQFTLDNG